MKIIDQLAPRPAPTAEPVSYHRQKIRPEFKDTERRLRAFLQTPRSAREVADHLGYTYAGARCSILRFVERGLVKVVSKKGTRPVLYLWI